MAGGMRWRRTAAKEYAVDDGDGHTAWLHARFRHVVRGLRSRLPRYGRRGLRWLARPLVWYPVLQARDLPPEPFTMRLCPQLLLMPRRVYPRRRLR
jgi:hypothetical protein